MGKKAAKRVATAGEAAKQLGITWRRLYEMQKTSPWWKPEFKSDEGWDVEAIRAAKDEHHSNAATRHSVPKELTELKRNAMAESAAAKARLKRVENSVQAIEFEIRRRRYLPADQYATQTREILTLIRRRIEEIPLRVSRQARREDARHFMNDEGTSKLELQIAEVIAHVGEWLNGGQPKAIAATTGSGSNAATSQNPVLADPSEVLKRCGAELTPSLRLLVADVESAILDAAMRNRHATDEEQHLEQLTANLLPVAVWTEFVSELRAILTEQLQAIPDRLAASLPKSARTVASNAKGTSTLQREIEKVLQDAGEWLNKSVDEEPDQQRKGKR